jgi:MarR family transcriptional regulator, organic hydroperoxide resistance regulator
VSPDDQTVTQTPLGFTTAAAARKLAKFYAAALAGGPVTPSQLFFLRQLWIEDGLSLAVLRERAQLDATSASWLADQLEKAGLIERRRNDPDRRVVRVWLTGTGRALHDELGPQIQRWEGSLRDTLAAHHTRQEVDAFEAVLQTVIEALPEGDDLWAELSVTWDTTLDALRRYLESEEH